MCKSCDEWDGKHWVYLLVNQYLTFDVTISYTFFLNQAFIYSALAIFVAIIAHVANRKLRHV